MGKIFTAIICFFLIGNRAGMAQTGAKLAVAGVTAVPELAKKFAPPATTSNAPATGADSSGVWNGSYHHQGKEFPFVLTITKAADGSEYAEYRNVKRGNLFHSTSVSCAGRHITINFSEGGKEALLDGNLDATGSQMAMKWRNGSGVAELTLTRAQMLSSSQLTAGTVAPPVDLAVVRHKLDVQLADHFEAVHLFNILEDADLKTAVPSRDEINPVYNLKDLDTLRQLKQAGIAYLLVTTLEDFKCETVDKAQGRVAYQTGAAKMQSEKIKTRNETDRAAAGSALKTQGQFDPHRVIEQELYLSVRCRLFEVATGGLLNSANYSFATNRTYIALAQGSKEVSTDDLVDAAARNISQWAVSRECDMVFPITVLEKTEKDVTINQGSDAGLRVGQIYNVIVVGKDIEDHVTGEVLGHNENVVGRVSLAELQPKISKARIWEDKGITVGALLRCASSN